ncbi:MAG: DUF4239 domain-containing protein [Planctomycetes bacterium]|nr:DUF4239 domain-containing protein [Planctomycetota bacterium]
MSSLGIALITLACMIGGLLLGVILRYILPEHHTKDDAKDMMKTAAGMMATLIALIIGLLVSSAKSSFDATSGSLTQGGAKIITLDHILSRYGPEAKEIRERLKSSVASGVKRVWPDDVQVVDMAAAEKATGMQDVYDMVRALKPANESQEYLKSQALSLSADLMQTRWLLIEQSQNSVPTLFLVVLIFWLTVLFACFGILTPRNFTSIAALSICAASMAGAIFLIMELNHPLEGTIKVSNAPLLKALSHIGK